jgi:hypothetical protein
MKIPVYYSMKIYNVNNNLKTVIVPSHVNALLCCVYSLRDNLLGVGQRLDFLYVCLMISWASCGELCSTGTT